MSKEQRAVSAVLELSFPSSAARILARLLVQGDASTQASLARELGMSEGRVSDGVEWLFQRGLVRVQTGRREGSAGHPGNVVFLTAAARRRVRAALRPHEEGLRLLAGLLEGA